MQENILNKAKSHFNLGLELFHDCKYLESEHEFLYALELFPERLSIISNIIKIYITTEDANKLHSFLERFQHLNNKQEIILGHAYKYYFYKQYDHSIDLCSKLIKQIFSEKVISVTEIDAHNLIAKNLTKKKDFLKVIKIYKKVIFNNRSDGLTHYNIGNFLFEIGKVRQAYLYFKKANFLSKERNKIILWNMALCALTLEDLKFGFELYENRFDVLKIEKKFGNIKTINQINDIFDKNILIWDEQGLGDAILFSRFVKNLLKYSKKITLVVDKRLKNILQYLSKDILVTDYESLNHSNFDYQISICSLPHLLKIDSIKEISYNKLELPKINKNPENIEIKKELFNVGLSWFGNPNYPRDEYRSIPFENFKPLIQLKGFQFFKLSKNLPKKDLLEFNYFNIYDLGDKNFFDLSYYLQKLDVVVSSDTSIIHLCGALGIKSILLLNFNSDWRWFQNKRGTVWYPTVKIIKQKKINDWESVFKNLELELQDMYKNKFR